MKWFPPTAAALLLAAPPATAATLDVCPTGCSFSDLPAALAAASAGDEVAVVAAGTYEACVTVPAGVLLSGDPTDRAAVLIEPSAGCPSFDPVIELAGSVRDLSVEGGFTGIYVPSGAGATATNVAVSGATSTALWIDAAAFTGDLLELRGGATGIYGSSATVTITRAGVVGEHGVAIDLSDSVVDLDHLTVARSGTTGFGVGLSLAGGSAEVAHSIFAGWATGVDCGVAATVERSLYWNNGVDRSGCADPEGLGDILDDPLLAWAGVGVDAEDVDYHLQVGSPAIDVARAWDDSWVDEPAGGCLANLGAFGGTAEAAVGTAASCHATNLSTGEQYGALYLAANEASPADLIELCGEQDAAETAVLTGGTSVVGGGACAEPPVLVGEGVVIEINSSAAVEGITILGSGPAILIPGDVSTTGLVVITDVTIEGAQYGVWVDGAAVELQVTRLDAIDVGQGIRLVDVGPTLVEDSTFTNATTYGVVVVAVVAGASASIEGSAFVDCEIAILSSGSGLPFTIAAISIAGGNTGIKGQGGGPVTLSDVAITG